MAGTEDGDLQRELLSIFSAEAEERVAAINRHLLAMEANSAPGERGPVLADVFREAHSLKGAARAVGLMDVETVAHQLENVFGEMKRGTLAPDPGGFDLIFRAADAIGSLSREGVTGVPAGVNVGALCAELATLLGTAETRIPIDHDTASGVAEPARGPAPGEDTLRLPATKVDSIMATVGELLVTSIGVRERAGDVRKLAGAMESWDQEWRAAYPSYRSLLRTLDTNDGALVAWEALLAFLDRNEAQLRSMRGQVGELRRRIEGDWRRLSQVTDDLGEDVRRARMVPMSSLFDVYPRMVRDLARELGKDVELRIQGGATEADRSVLEQIGAPLTHLVRNAIDHGVESPAERTLAGKPRRGTVSLTARQVGSAFEVEVHDDGGGIDPARVRSSAVASGVLSDEAARELGDGEAIRLIFRSGLSTSPMVTDLSGRGIGLDVVRDTVERLHGAVEAQSEPGRWTRFTLRLPLTVATVPCLLVEAGGQRLALPVTSLTRIVRCRAEDIGRTGSGDAILVDGSPTPLHRLGDLLGLPAVAEANGSRPAVVLQSADRTVAFLVDSLGENQDVVVKSLPRPMETVPYAAGATILSGGDVVIVLNVAELTRAATATPGREPAPQHAPAPRAGPYTILLADDSFTTRTLEKNILETAGYQVRVASDGLEAWSLLVTEPVDLVVSDVAMPRMDGFQLTAKLRTEERLKDLPVILVTSLDSLEDRERGVEAGADAYIVKGAFNQEGLLDTIRRLL